MGGGGGRSAGSSLEKQEGEERKANKQRKESRATYSGNAVHFKSVAEDKAGLRIVHPLANSGRKEEGPWQEGAGQMWQVHRRTVGGGVKRINGGGEKKEREARLVHGEKDEKPEKCG